MEVHMMLKTGAGVAVLTVLLGTSAAIAQAPTPQQRPAPAPAPSATEAPKKPVTGQILAQDADTMLAKDMIGQTVYAADKAKIGTISDLILSKDAKTVDGFVIGVGGFLGIGEKSVALKLDRLVVQHNGDGSLQLMMDVNKEELTNAPTFKSKKDQDAERQAAERARNQPPSSQPPSQAPRPTQR
jgi:hypothetical protein